MAKVYGQLALIALLVFAGVSLWYGRVEERLQEKIPTAHNEAATLPEQEPSESEPVTTDYQIILTRNIFKAALELGEKPSGEQPQTDVEDLAETKMQLVLLGTVSGSKEDARAIIRDEKAKLEDIYHVGSELNGATITRIGRGKVVLQVNGREEVLNIKDPESGGPQQGASSAAEIPQPGAQPEGLRERRAPVVVPQRRISFRDKAPATPAPAVPAPEDTGASLPAGEPATPADDQPVPDDEKPLAGSEESNNAAGQQAQ